MSYTHRARVFQDGPPRPECGSSGRCVMHMAEVDCPDCVRLDADRQARTELHDAHSIPADDAAVPVGELVERIEWLEQVVAGLVERLDTAPVKQDLMTPGEVIDMFGITPKTLRKWVKDGLIAYIVLPSGHRRYLRAEIEAYFKTTREAGS